MHGRKESECRALYIEHRNRHRAAKAKSEHKDARYSLERMSYYKAWLITNNRRVPTDQEED